MSYQLIEKQVDVNEHRICYLEGGIATSTPLLFVHGWSVSTEPYQEFLNALSQRYQIIAPVLPGFWKSSGSQLNWDYNDYANFLISFLNTLNIKKVHLIGNSLGGGINITLAATMPSVVESLILVDSTGVPVDPAPKVLFQRLIEMTAQVPQIRFPQIIQVFQAFTANFLFNPQDVIQTLWLALNKDLRPLLNQIESPCLIMWGANDLTTRLPAAQELAQSIKNSNLVVVDGVYHEWSIFLVEKSTSIIFNFIDEIEARK